MTIHDAETRSKRDPNPNGQLTEEFRNFLKSKGADLVGFGSVQDMEGAPEIMQPQRYLPDAQSMIAIGLHINEASCDLIERSVQKVAHPLVSLV